MSLLDRARARRDDRDGVRADERAASDLRARGAATVEANRILELDGDERIVSGMLEPVFSDRTGRGALYQFTYEGLCFIVGSYWRDGIDKHLLAVQVATVRGWPEWPPPSPQSASNTDWAPAGYRPVHSLAQLADVFEKDGAGRRPPK